MEKLFGVLNMRVLLALVIALFGLMGVAGAASAQDESTPVATEDVADDGAGDDTDGDVSELPETGQGSTSADSNSSPVLLIVAAGTMLVAGVALMLRMRRA